jgi:hypothetical protein
MRWYEVAPRLAVGLASLALLGGCAAGTAFSPTPTQRLITPFPSRLPPPSSPPSPSPLLPPASSASTSQAPTPTGSLVGTVAVTVSDRLRVRSEPRVSDDSIQYKPVLPLGTTLNVVGGPIVASGYTWYEVEPVGFELDAGITRGWVAMADHDGTLWVASQPSSVADCGVVPITPALLAGEFLTVPPAPSTTGAAMEVLVGETDSDPLTGFMQSRDFAEVAPEWKGRWESAIATIDPQSGNARLDTGTPTDACNVRVHVPFPLMSSADGVGAGPIRLELADGTVIVLGPERCWWRGFAGPGQGSITCHGAREPQWARLMVWARWSFRDAIRETPSPVS